MEPAKKRESEMSPIRAIVIDPSVDNVATAITSLDAGEVVEMEGGTITLIDEIPVGHKFATRPIPTEEEVLKYGEPIGVTTAPIGAGNHVHVHNVVSVRLPGPEEGR
jgi:altronate dehydratase small subunit